MQRVYSGKDFAKVLIYHGFIGEVTQSIFKIVCPFHEDNNPSMVINLEENSFFCFGCEAKGDVLDFVKMLYPKYTEIQACLILEKILHNKAVENIQVTYQKKQRKSNLVAIEESYTYYYGLKHTNWFELKDNDERAVYSYMSKRGFSKRDLFLSKCKVSYSIAYPVIFPILDNGEFRGYVCRTMDKLVEKKRKYLYNDGFNKNNTLCGNYADNSVVFLCEGYFDYLSLRLRGHIKNVVALLGWHISDTQVQKLKDKGIKTVVSALDNDKCGKKGTEYLKQFFHVIRFTYPKGVKDVGEMNEELLQKAIKKTKEREREKKNNGTIRDKNENTQQNRSHVERIGKNRGNDKR